MAVDRVPRGPGTQTAKLICDECQREEVAACGYVKNHKLRRDEPDAGQIRRKLGHHGWTYVKGRDYCPACEAKRKVVNLKQKAEQMKPEPEPALAPTPKQKREILAILSDVYDTDAERYIAGETDATVATATNTRPGWVAELRDEFFGPAGDNEDMAKMAAALEAQAEEVAEQIKQATAVLGDLRRTGERIADMQRDLEAIRKAVGGHVLARAKVGNG